jgi:hypothetical protein
MNDMAGIEGDGIDWNRVNVGAKGYGMDGMDGMGNIV